VPRRGIPGTVPTDSTVSPTVISHDDHTARFGHFMVILQTVTGME
jgi:hypothetical protein